MRRPNVVIIVVDTARADAFEPYGAAAGTTPTVAQLAAVGHAAPAVHAPSSWTLPSHAGLFTGLPPRSVGLAQATSPSACAPVLRRHRRRLLPEVLRRHGYATRAVSCNVWVGAESGFDTGFDEFVTVRGGRQTGMSEPGVLPAMRWAWHSLQCRSDDGTGEAEAALEGFLAARDDRPFFWFVNLVECHSPYLPPRPWTDLGAVDRVRAGLASRRHLNFMSIWRTCLARAGAPASDLALMRHLYARSVALVDAWVGRLLERLDAARVLDETLVVVTSDHGENFGEGGLVGHAFSLDERLVRVPFVAAGPGAPRLDGVVSLVDLPRWIAGAVGITDHPWGASPMPLGLAISQVDAPAERTDARARRAIDDWGLGDAEWAHMTTPQTAVSDGRRKVLRNAAGDAWYDLVDDPLEAHPRAIDGAPVALREALEAASAPGPRWRGDDGAHGERPEIEDQMRLLGYL